MTEQRSRLKTSVCTPVSAYVIYKKEKRIMGINRDMEKCQK